MRRARLLLLALLLPATAPAAVPRVAITYSPAFDTVCSLLRGAPVDAAWQKELAQLQPHFEAQWALRGPGLLRATEEVVGKPFPSDAVSARLTLCDIPSNALLGVMVNMRYALRSFTDAPVPVRYKLDTLYHELLHVYLDAYPPPASGLAAHWAREPARVRDHLHLLALEKAVLLRLHEPDELAELVRLDSELPGGFYKRAWEIVNEQPDTYRRYVSELAAPRKRSD